MQIKILVLVFLFMTILMLMGKARNPDSWSWMWHLDKSGQATRGSAAESKSLDTRPSRRPVAEPTDGSPIVIGNMAMVQPRSLPGKTLEASIQQAQLDGWTRVLQELDSAERQQLYAILWNVRHDRPLEEKKRVFWNDVLDRLDQNWTLYAKAAKVVLAQEQTPLTEKQSDRMRQSVEAAVSEWNRIKPALMAAATPDRLTNEQQAQLESLQSVLDRVAISKIEDNTALGRSCEREAWFRFWEILQQTDGQQPASELVTFVQLFSQPVAYRGRLVHLQGVARMAYHVSASPNPYGIAGYYVFAVRLSPTDQSPVIVYALDTPPGFPEIADRDLAGATSLREPIELTGVFFKRWVYQSASGPNLAPLVLASIARWEPEPPSRATSLPSGRVLLAGVFGTALLGVLIAWWVYRRSNRSPVDRARIARPAEHLPLFDDQPVRGNVAESLEQLRDPSTRNDSDA